MKEKIMLIITAVALVAGSTGCSDINEELGKDGGGNDAVRVSGTAAFTDASASFVLNFDDADADGEVNGTITYGNPAVTYSLTGTYTAQTGAITVSNTDADPHFEITGIYSVPGGFSGTVERTIGGTPSTGSVTGQEGEAAVNYLGTFTATSPAFTGQWNFSVSGNSFSGTFSSPLWVGKIEGTISGAGMTVTAFYQYDDGTSQYRNISEAGITGTATGTVSLNSVNGTWAWTGNQVNNGTFTGTKQE